MTDPNRTEPEGFDPFEPATPIASSQGAPRNMAKDPTQRPGWERATLEKLAFASLNEQRAARRWKTFTRLSWLAFFIFLVWLAMSPTAATPARNSSWPQ
jgi:protease-4